MSDNRKLITRQLCLTSHLGTKEILFGGQMLAWADIAASIWCMQIVRAGSDSMITVHMSDNDFMAAVRVGDIVEFYGESFKVGRTSVTVQIIVKIYDPRSGTTSKAFRYTAVMVNIDGNLKSTPLLADVQNTGWSALTNDNNSSVER
ncbi:MAG: acyl-CoA thioesterase [Candidatus Electryoneaceae bacterium]|nr:acyl-CoA thioesterase [Candidatus Electryoneaceae bacterium]